MIKNTLVLFSFLALLGCATVGVQFDSSKVAQIEKGVTTQEDALELFGEPMMKGTGISDGKILTVWYWSYASVGGGSSNVSGQDMTIHFYENKVYGYQYVSTPDID